MVYCACRRERESVYRLRLNYINTFTWIRRKSYVNLVTGGAGFIGSHTCVELLNAGYEVVVADNLYNASEKAIERVKEITGKELTFYKADIRDREAMNRIFDKEDIESVIHFAGLKAVGESVANLWNTMKIISEVPLPCAM